MWTKGADLFSRYTRKINFNYLNNTANPSTDSDHKWSTPENDSQD